MAFTISILARGVMGNLKYEMGRVTNTGTTGDIIVGGMDNVFHAEFTNQTSATAIKYTVATAGASTKPNTLSVTTASSDTFTYVAWGK